MVTTQIVLRFAEERGLPIQELCIESGINPKDIGNLNVRVSSDTRKVLVDAIIRRTGDKYFMLRPVEPELASMDNPLWYYFYNAATVRDALARGERFYEFLSDKYYPKAIELGQEVEVRWVCREDQPTPDFKVDWMFSGWWGMLGIFAGPDLKLKAVRLAEASPDRVDAYHKFFQVPVETGTPKDALVFDIEMLDLPNIRRDIDPNLDMLLSRYIKEAVPDLQGEKDIFQTAFDTVQHQLLHGTPTIEKVSGIMGMSPRTLQRRLRERDKSFSELVRDVRRELSASYLSQENLSISEIAFMLGFSNANSFSKSFREWYGLSPSQYREHPQPPPPLSVN